MNVSDLLAKIIASKESIRTAIAAKEIDLPSSVPFYEYDKSILKIKGGTNVIPSLMNGKELFFVAYTKEWRGYVGTDHFILQLKKMTAATHTEITHFDDRFADVTEAILMLALIKHHTQVHENILPIANNPKYEIPASETVRVPSKRHALSIIENADSKAWGEQPFVGFPLYAYERLFIDNAHQYNSINDSAGIGLPGLDDEGIDYFINEFEILTLQKSKVYAVSTRFETAYFICAPVFMEENEKLLFLCEGSFSIMERAELSYPDVLNYTQASGTYTDENGMRMLSASVKTASGKYVMAVVSAVKKVVSLEGDAFSGCFNAGWCQLVKPVTTTVSAEITGGIQTYWVKSTFILGKVVENPYELITVNLGSAGSVCVHLFVFKSRVKVNRELCRYNAHYSGDYFALDVEKKANEKVIWVLASTAEETGWASNDDNAVIYKYLNYNPAENAVLYDDGCGKTIKTFTVPFAENAEIGVIALAVTLQGDE